jgi:hypothetical protein
MAAGSAPAMAAPGREIRIQHRGLQVVGNEQAISFHGETFPLAEVDRVAYRAVASRVNGAYMGTSFWLRLGRPGKTSQFMLDGGSRDKRLDEFQAAWSGLVDLVEAAVCPRLAQQAVTTISAGGTVTYGSIVAGPDGVKARRPLAKTIPWADVTGTQVNNVGIMQVLVRQSGGKTKGKLSAGLDQWNTVVLPRVVRHLARGT